MMENKMPILLTDEAVRDLFDHLFDPDQNGEEYVRLNDLDGEDIAHRIGFDSSANFELKLFHQPHQDIELEVALLDHYRKRVVYFNRVEVVEDIPVKHDKPVAQVMIWRDRTFHGDAASGLAGKVFFELLVNQYDVVVSDSEQTREGRGMWIKLLSKAIENPDLLAGTLDKKEGEFTKLSSEKDLYNAQSWLWGNEAIHRNRLGLIQKINSALMLFLMPALFSFAGTGMV